MKKLFTLLCILFPGIALAANDGFLNFAPPASDYSVIFLGNLFGVVDGVLHGTGSQMLGNIFGVFNSAVLALGGIIITYTLLVSTMNTAHEGQVLGQKWNSIWIPVRSTMGLALLIPKASGYCLMQIFVMWVIVQGVGAADKVWNAALDYMNRGGVIIQAEVQNPLGAKDTPMSVAKGAATILSGQVCMLGVQNILEDQRKQFLQMKDNQSGPCYQATGVMANFCNTAVPDFLSTVNAVEVQDKATANASVAAISAQSSTATKTFEMPMPNFDADSPYSYLNGICGTVKWDSFDKSTMESMRSVAGGDSLETIELSRPIGIQAMYSNLQNVARIIINNDPAFSKSSNDGSTSSNFNEVAEDQFGVPYTQTQNVCTSSSDTCVLWSTAPGARTTNVLFNGTQFMGAIQDYNSVLNPAISLQNQSQNLDNALDERSFIQGAQAQGWIMAGSYFFDLVRLNGSANASDNKFDVNSGLDQSQFVTSPIVSSFGNDNTCSGTYATLCYWMDKKVTQLSNLVTLIDGSGMSTNAVKLPAFSSSASTPIKTVTNEQSSTVFGYITNSMAMTTPGQPGLSPDFTFAKTMNIDIQTSQYRLQKIHFDCGRFMLFCWGWLIGNVLYNIAFLTVYNIFLDLFQNVIESVIYAFIMMPIGGMMAIFNQGLQILSIPGINPIVALADMGIVYINFAADLWMNLLMIAVTSSVMPIFGLFIFALIGMGLPLLIAWTGIMVAVGFTTAYYVPILPYMMFTLGAFAWLMAVVEAMVAGPIVALGITHPEGHEAFGKAEGAVMILANVFLRPSMMIIGYIAGIALSYVGVWMLNAGFEHAISFMQPADPNASATGMTYTMSKDNQSSYSTTALSVSANQTSIKYSSWAAIYAYFFSILLYTTIYLTLVQKSFTLISSLPDKVLRWIGGQQESYGSESAQWAEEGKKQVQEAGSKSQQAQSQIDKKATGAAMKGMGAAKSALMGGGGSAKAGGDPGGGGGSGAGPGPTTGGPAGGGGGGMPPPE